MSSFNERKKAKLQELLDEFAEYNPGEDHQAEDLSRFTPPNFLMHKLADALTEIDDLKGRISKLHGGS